MGACYYVRYRLYPNDEEKCKEAVKEYLTKNGIHNDFQAKDSLEDMIRIVFLADNKYSEFIKQGKDHYSGFFDASYSWESVLLDAFSAMIPYLKDGSMAYIEPDNEHYRIVVKNGDYIYA